MKIDKDIAKISLLSFLLGCGGLGLALNGNTILNAKRKEFENPICKEYFGKIREDFQDNHFIPYYIFAKDKILNSYDRPSACD